MDSPSSIQKLNNVTVKDLQLEVDKWIKTTGGGYFDIMTNTAILMEEVGELARVIARTEGMQVAKDGEILNFNEELTDILWVLICLANQKDVDLTKELHANFVKKTKRDSNRFIN
jgi:NTP pyrophosphatase (non-canonical NTP hydrolase)